MGHGGFKLQVQQRIFKTSDEIPWKKPWKRWKTKNVSHFPTALLRLSIRIHSRSLLHLEFECAHPSHCMEQRLANRSHEVSWSPTLATNAKTSQGWGTRLYRGARLKEICDRWEGQQEAENQENESDDAGLRQRNGLLAPAQVENEPNGKP